MYFQLIRGHIFVLIFKCEMRGLNCFDVLQLSSGTVRRTRTSRRRSRSCLTRPPSPRATWAPTSRTWPRPARKSPTWRRSSRTRRQDETRTTHYTRISRRIVNVVILWSARPTLTHFEKKVISFEVAMFFQHSSVRALHSPQPYLKKLNGNNHFIFCTVQFKRSDAFDLGNHFPAF